MKMHSFILQTPLTACMNMFLVQSSERYLRLFIMHAVRILEILTLNIHFLLDVCLNFFLN